MIKMKKVKLTRLELITQETKSRHDANPVAKGDIGDCRYGNKYGANNDDKAAPRLF